MMEKVMNTTSKESGTHSQKRRDNGAEEQYFIDNLQDDDLVLEELREKIYLSSPDTFSWLEYWCFFTLGLSMMWTWSAIIAAAPLFISRLRGDKWILQHFQAFNLVVFSITIFCVNFGLTKYSANASYQKRLKVSVLMYMTIPLALALSTLESFAADPLVYFLFLLSMAFFTAVANGLSQNAAFAFVAGFGRPEYTPAIMTGEAVAGILPSAIEMILTLLNRTSISANTNLQATSTVALCYFMSASLVGGCSLTAVELLVGYKRKEKYLDLQPGTPLDLKLWKKLRWVATANLLCLFISSVFPVFASRIVSVVPPDNSPKVLRPEVFIPFSILCWNTGDLIGSALTLFSTSLARRPYLLLILSLSRLGFIPLYLLCNIDGRGSVVGDMFYLVVVQFLFGWTHGFLSSTCMLGVPIWVNVDERESAGAFMGLSLVFGLALGSGLGLATTKI